MKTKTKSCVSSDVEMVFSDLRNCGIPRSDKAFKKLKCPIQHGLRVYWYFESDAEYAKEYDGEDPRVSPPCSGLMIARDGIELRGGSDSEIDYDECIVIVDQYPTEKCYPATAWIALGSLLDADDLVEVFTN